MEPRVLWALAIILALVVPGHATHDKVTWMTKYILRYKYRGRQFALEMMKYPVHNKGHSSWKDENLPTQRRESE